MNRPEIYSNLARAYEDLKHIKGSKLEVITIIHQQKDDPHPVKINGYKELSSQLKTFTIDRLTHRIAKLERELGVRLGRLRP